MSTAIATQSDAPRRCDQAARVTKSLLGYGVIAGPFYLVVAVLQGLLRPGFDLTRDDVSLLSNGNLGWIQVANFIVTGLMVVAFATGVRRALAPARGSSWAGVLLGAYGVGLIAAGVFVADPMNGFPAGAPVGHPASTSIHGMLHIVAAGIAFLALVAGCFEIAACLRREGANRLAVISRVTGSLFLVSFAAVASGSGSPIVVAGFWIALLVAWSWMAGLAVHLYRRMGALNPVPPLASAA